MRNIYCIFLLFAYYNVTGQMHSGMVAVRDGKLTIQNNTVKIKGFYMDTCEVTVADFEKFINSTGYKTDAEKNGTSTCYGGRSIANVTWRCNTMGKLRPVNEYDRPVIHVSYNDAMAYAKWAKKRLPTEEEWMYAASHKHGGRTKQIAWFTSLRGDIHPVGKLKPNILGIYDLFGNVYEIVNTVNEAQKAVKLKGNCFLDEENIGIEHYAVTNMSTTSHITGFRCVKDL
jgi:formylglycine-generating enzyme required for sulfatase activity